MSSDLLKLNGVTLIANKFVKIWANENAVSEFLQNSHAILLWFVLKSTYNTVSCFYFPPAPNSPNSQDELQFCSPGSRLPSILGYKTFYITKDIAFRPVSKYWLFSIHVTQVHIFFTAIVLYCWHYWLLCVLLRQQNFKNQMETQLALPIEPNISLVKLSCVDIH